VTAQRKRGGLRAAVAGLGAALQWRLLLLWTLGLLVPALLATLPLWRMLANGFDHAVGVDAIAARLDLPAFIDVFGDMGPAGGALGGSLAGSALFVLLLLPWLHGMTLASIRAGHRLGFAGLLQGGLAEYWRMLRMTLWSLLPLGAALALGGVAMKAADATAASAILEADADSAQRWATVAMAVLFLFAHATGEAARGVLGAEPARRSVVRAWGRGLLLLLRRPLAMSLAYLLPTLAGVLLAAGLGALRVLVAGPSWMALLAGFVLVQLLVAALGWGRSARLFALADLARHDAQRRGVRHGPMQHEHAARHALHAQAGTGRPASGLAIA
jgi:hypothetical protein